MSGKNNHESNRLSLWGEGPRSATVSEIEDHLLKLGGGNHEDNVARITEYPRHYLISLTDQAFLDLVFMESRTVCKIVPPDSDRRLKAVAQRALNLSPTDTNLGGNWDIASIRIRFEGSNFRDPNFRLPALVLRDTRDSETRWSPDGWYLQDGCHRALGYCMAILAGDAEFRPQLAFCATSKNIPTYA